MAVTITGKRLHSSSSQAETRLFIQYTLSGTYVTGGFVTPFSTVTGNPGTSTVNSRTPLLFTWQSPLGYDYYTAITFAANGIPTCTTKCFVSGGVELTNGTAVPDTVILAAVDAQKY